MKSVAVAIAAGLLSVLSRKEDKLAIIPSHKIEQKKEIQQLSKQKIQKMKGKKNRKNRGRNRKPQDTALYATLKR